MVDFKKLRDDIRDNLHVKSMVFGIAIGLVASLYTSCRMEKYPFLNYVPSETNVQHGYIAPSDIEVICEDYDNNVAPETYLKVHGKLYPLVWDKPITFE